MTRRVVLVTGAGGFVGRWSVPPLLARGYEVHAVLSTVSNRTLPAPLGVAEVHRADLLQPSAIDALLRAVAPTHLLHFAWIATPGVYWNSPDNQRWLSASQHLLRGFAECGGVRAVAAGTCAEYDWSHAVVCNERTTPLADAARTPVSPYAACKLALERTFAAAQLSTAWGRLFFQFGPHEHPRRLVASVIVDLLAGRAALCSHGRQVRSFLHVADVGAAFAALLDSAVRGPVNIGSAERTSIAALVERIARHIERPELVRLGARSAPPGEPAVLVPDVARLAGEVGWQPGFNLETAIADTVAWWRSALAGRPAPPP